MEEVIEVEESKGKNKGFTLVELLIVIVILGILAAVTVFAVRGITDNAQENACSVDGKNYETALEAYYADTGAYIVAPAAAAPLAPTGAETIASKAVVAALLVDDYVKSIPDDFFYTGTATDYTLIGTGKCTVAP